VSAARFQNDNLGLEVKPFHESEVAHFTALSQKVWPKIPWQMALVVRDRMTVLKHFSLRWSNDFISLHR
jgi:hypothetical protein